MGAPTTAKATPLRNSYWVLPGKVLAGEHPAGTNREATRERLQRLLDAGVECFIDLTEPAEMRAYDPELPLSVEYLRKPIKDHSIPGHRSHMAEILDCIHDAMQSGRCVYIHCRAGIGRTGTVVGCFLVERGLAGDAALDELNRLWQHCERSSSWPSVPETSDQSNYVQKWKRRGIFDDTGNLATTGLQTALQSDEDDDLPAAGGSAPWAHLLSDRAQPSAGAPTGASGGARSNTTGSASTRLRGKGADSTGPNAGSPRGRSATDPGTTGPTNSPSLAGASTYVGPGTSRTAIANAARAAASQSTSDDVLTDPTSVAKLAQPTNPQQGRNSTDSAGTRAPPTGAGSSPRQASGRRSDASAGSFTTPASPPGSAARSSGRPQADTPGWTVSDAPPGPGAAASRGAPEGAHPVGPRTREPGWIGAGTAASPAGAAATRAPAAGYAASPRPDASGNAAPTSPRRPGGTQPDDPSRPRSAQSPPRPAQSPPQPGMPLRNPAATADIPIGESGAFRALGGDADPMLDPEALEAVNNLRGRFLGALIGLAVGDAVAAATQYRRPGSFTPVGDMLGGGPFDLPRGGWSDDTAMALCLADSLLERDGFDARDQVERYRRWQQEGYLSATGQCVGITASSARAIAMAQWRRQAFFGSHDPSQQDPEPLSRVAPAVLFFFAISGEAVNQATEAARTTCQAPAVLDACRALAQAVYAALTGQPKAVVLERAALAVTPGAATAGTNGTSVDGETRSAVGGPGAAPAQRAGASAPVALAAAAAAFGATDNFRDAILYAANLGGDSDVVAAACGQLAGAYYGVKAIPTSWYNGLMQKELIVSYADRLLAHAMVGLGG